MMYYNQFENGYSTFYGIDYYRENLLIDGGCYKICFENGRHYSYLNDGYYKLFINDLILFSSTNSTINITSVSFCTE